MAKGRATASSHGGTVAYFSMEIGLQADIPTYSGGLGVLAGDTIRAAADVGVPMVAVTLLYHKGYFHQELDENGRQTETAVQWHPADCLKPLRKRVTVTLEERDVKIRAWRYDAVGVTGAVVPVLFLDTDLPGNDERDRRLCHHLYGGDQDYRLGQEYVLGVGGVRMLGALGYEDIRCFHMNEGHAAFLTLELLDRATKGTKAKRLTAAHIERVRSQCVFTTHTPVPAGHDRFSLRRVRRIIGDHKAWSLRKALCDSPGTLNMTYLALKFSRYVNGVAKQHGATSRAMFPAYEIDSITNGVHAATWTAPPFQKLLDKYVPGWREDNVGIRYALSVPEEEIWNAHARCKTKLIRHIARTHGVKLDPDAFTIGFARRATAYKRLDLVLHSASQLKKIAARAGAFQIVFAGKAHPKDEAGKKLIRQVFKTQTNLEPAVRIVYLPEYDMDLAGILIPGVDVWLNTPRPPHEASGTSGMKAALNAVPSLSILDGWWTEGCVENLTGWAIQSTGKPKKGKKDGATALDARALYRKLEKTVIPMFYHDRPRYVQIMRAALALNGSYFNTQRMLQEYLVKAYQP